MNYKTRVRKECEKETITLLRDQRFNLKTRLFSAKTEQEIEYIQMKIKAINKMLARCLESQEMGLPIKFTIKK